MRSFLILVTLVFSTFVIAEGAVYTAAETQIGTLLDDPAATAVLEKHMPGFTQNDQISMARGMTLKAVQSFTPDTMTDEILAKIDSDLAALPQE